MTTLALWLLIVAACTALGWAIALVPLWLAERRNPPGQEGGQ